jgi:hypothetical protein
VLLALICCAALGAVERTARGQQATIPPEIASALDRISVDSLRGHLSFIASDLLEGRNTPSRGLDIAAEYIAAQFRRAGLEPAGDDNYFQTANWKMSEVPAEGFELSIALSGRRLEYQTNQISLAGVGEQISLAAIPVLKVKTDDQAALDALTAGEVKNKAILTEGSSSAALNRLAGKLGPLGPALIVAIDRTKTTGRGFGPPRLIDPERTPASGAPGTGRGLIVHDPELGSLYDALPPGLTPATLTLKAPAIRERPVKLRNVIGVLRGSDPILKDTYVLVTAHYDHIGVRPDLEGDPIYNGANDDGSGTVTVIELASALAGINPRPKRSIVFMTVFGEEKGLLGSRYYGRHPVFPLEKTIANINLEQVGRTDSSEGSQVNRASITGFDYSDLGEIFKAAGAATGIEVYQHAQNSDAFFSRSDNQALADAGIPSHTLCVAFIYPDYHRAGDHWDKIDYVNLARTARMVGLGLVMTANRADAPKWNEANPKTARYVEAWKKLHAR